MKLNVGTKASPKAEAAHTGFLDSFISALVGSQFLDSMIGQQQLQTRQSENVQDMSKPLDTIHYNQDYQPSDQDLVRGFFFDKGMTPQNSQDGARNMGLGPILDYLDSSIALNKAQAKGK